MPTLCAIATLTSYICCVFLKMLARGYEVRVEFPEKPDKPDLCNRIQFPLGMN